jgi:outer membrane autotransporter protein
LDVASGASLAFDRNSVIRVAKKVSSLGFVEVRKGETIFQSAQNSLSGSLAVAPGAVLQIGDAGNVSLLGTAPLGVSIADGATLRFVNVVPATPGAPASTGAALALSGVGTVEYRGDGILRQDSNNAAFGGTFLASAGTFVFAAASLPAAATLDAAGSGVLKIESAAPTTTFVAPKFGTGDGTLLFAPANPAVPAAFTFTQGAAFTNGSLAVDSGATLHLSTAGSLSAKEFVIRSGATLDGAGTLHGTLRNEGTLAPSSAIGVAGDFVNTGLLVVTVGAGGVSTISFSGVATIATASTLQLQTTAASYETLLGGREIQILRDTVPAVGGKPEISGAFLPANITVSVDGEVYSTPALTYNKGDGWLTMILSDNLLDIPGVRGSLHDGLGGFAEYLNTTLREDGGQLTDAIGGILGAPGGVAKAINAASPVGLAAVTSMSISSAHDDTANLHSHLEASRFSRYYLKSPNDTEVYFTASGNYEQNAGRSGPAFDYNIYGGTVGIDHSLGTQLLAGISATYHRWRATSDYASGTVAQDNARLAAYASIQFTESLYLDASLHGGYSYYEVKHRSAGGSAGAEPEGHDFGAGVFLSSSVGVTESVSLTPYGGFEYDYARVDAFTEKAGHGASDALALRVDSFDQESLRFKIGTGLNWLLPVQQLRTLRLGMDLAYAYEFLETDVELGGRFALDSSGRSFRVEVPAQSRHIIQVGPTVDIGFTDRMNLQFGYRFESNFEHQTSHHINATFRVRF